MAVNIYKLSGEVDVNIGKAEANLKRVDSSARKTQAGLNLLDGAGKKAGTGIASGFDRSASSATGLLGKINQVHSKLSSLKAPRLNFGGGGGGGFDVSGLIKGNLITGAITSALGGVTDAMKEGWQIGIEYQKVLENATVRMDRFFASTQQTKGFVADVEKFAALSPIFEMEEAVTGAQRLLQMKYNAAEVVPALKSIGDMVGGVGGNAETIDRVTRAFSQMATTGKIQGDEMLQLIDAGIPAYELLSKAIRRTEAETRKLVEAGRIDAKLGVRGMIAAGGAMFAGQSEKAGQTLTGKEAQLRSARDMQLARATSGNYGQLKEGADNALKGLGSSAATKFADETNKLLTDIGKTFEPTLQKFATGEYFLQGFDAMVSGRKAKEAFDRGDASAGMHHGGQAVGRALGAEYGAKGEDKLVDGIVGRMDGFDKAIAAPLVRGISGALQQVESIAKAGGALVGIKIGEGTRSGVEDELDMHSPSRVMLSLGNKASVSFGDGFNNGINEVINRTSDGIKKWAKAIEQAGGEEFLKAVEEMAKRLKIDPNKMMNVMAFESGLDPSKKNPNSSATGLIQFMNSTAASLGTTTDKLKGMDAIGQLKYVEEYFKQFQKVADTQEAVYTAVLAGKPVSSPDSVLFSKGSKATGRAYTANAALDADKSGTITAAEAAAKTYKQGFLSAGDGAKEAAGMFDQLSSALDSVKVRLSSLTDQAMQFVGLSAAPSAAIPKVVSQQRPGDGVSAKPFTGQTIQGGGMSVDVKAKTEMLALSKDAATATVQMLVPLKELPTVSAQATEALKATIPEIADYSAAIMDAGKATGEAIDHLSHFKDAFAGGFDQMFDDILNGQKTDMKSFGKQLFKGFLSSTISTMTGGKASSPGGMLSQMIFGGGGGSGTASGGGGVPATPGFAGGGGAGDVLNKAQSGMGLFQKGGALSKLPGLGKVGGFLKGLPGIGSTLGKLGGFLGFGGGGAAAGAAGAAGGAAGGGGMMSALMPGLMSNPFTAVAGIALAVGVPLLGKLFGKDPLSDYKKHIKSEYGVDASKQMAAKVMQIGQSKFGAEWQKRKIETVRLPEVRDMLSEYAGAFMKGGNSKLFNSAEYTDQFSAINQIKVKMQNGGRVPGQRRGYDHIPVLMDGGEVVISNDQQRQARGGGRARGGMFEKGIETVLERVAAALSRFESMPPDQVVVTTLGRNPDIAMDAVYNSANQRSERSIEFKKIMNEW